MEVFNKKELIKQLDSMKDLAKKCRNDMVFHAEFSFTGIDPKFMELATQFNIKMAEDGQKAREALPKRKDDEGNI